MAVAASSTGLSSRAGATLAYSGWWITGLIFLFAERRDPYLRFHAAQAVVVFGLAALLIVLFGALAVASLAFLPATFGMFVGAAAITWAAGVVVWGIAMWRAAGGKGWRMPVAAGWAERLDARLTASARASA